MNSTSQKTRGYLQTAISCRCPRCREGKLFVNGVSANMKKNMQMHASCPVCRQATELEVGFFYGTGYVSYAVTIVISIASLLLWILLIGMSVDDLRFVYWLITNAVILILLQPWLMRFSRSLWLSWFVRYDPDWRLHPPKDVSERKNAEQANNW